MEDATSAGGLSRRGRRRLVLGIHGALSLALVPAVLLWAPADATPALVLVAVLLALAVITDHHDVPLPSGIRFDATIALALIALVIAGPAATLLLLTAPMAVNALTGRERLWRAGNLANVASF